MQIAAAAKYRRRQPRQRFAISVLAADSGRDLTDDDANDAVSGYGPRNYIPRETGERLSNVAPPPSAVRKGFDVDYPSSV